MMKKARTVSSTRPPVSGGGVSKNTENRHIVRKTSAADKSATGIKRQSTSEKETSTFNNKKYLSKSHDNLASVLRRKAATGASGNSSPRPKSVIGLPKPDDNRVGQKDSSKITPHPSPSRHKSGATTPVRGTMSNPNIDKLTSPSTPLKKASSTQHIDKTPTSVKRASSTQNVCRDKVVRQRTTAPANILAYNAELLANFEKEKKVLEGRISDLRQVAENRKTDNERQKIEIKHLKEKLGAQSSEEMDKLRHENKLLKQRLQELGIPITEQITDSEKLSLLQRAGSTCSVGRDSEASPGKALHGNFDGETDSEYSVDLTCVTPEHPSSLSFDNSNWERQSNKSLDALSEVSVACLQDRLSQMEETHYSTSEELQATLQELGDLQSNVNELTSENEDLASERGVLLESLCAQTEKLEHCRIQIDHLKSLLIGDVDNCANKCDRECQLLDLIKTSQIEKDEIMLRQHELNNSLQSLEKEHVETIDIIAAMEDKIRLLEDKNQSVLADKKAAEDQSRELREKLDGERIDIQHMRTLLENEKGKVEELEQFRQAQDESELEQLLENTRQEKDRLEDELAGVREAFAYSQIEITKLKDQIASLEQEMKVIKNNARTSVSDMEYKLEILCTEKLNVVSETETLQEQIESLNQELDECLLDKKSYQDSLKSLQLQLDCLQQRNAELEREIENLKRQHDEECGEWEQFQSDLQKAVVIANDIKVETQEGFEKAISENIALQEKIGGLQLELSKVSCELETFKSDEKVKDNETPSIMASREIRGRVLTSVDRELRQTRAANTNNNQQSISVKNLIKTIEKQVQHSHACGTSPCEESTNALTIKDENNTPNPSAKVTINTDTQKESRRRSSAPAETHLKSAMKRAPENKENKTPPPSNRSHILSNTLYNKTLTDDAKASTAANSNSATYVAPGITDRIPETSTTSISSNILETSSILTSRKNSISEQEKKDPLVSLVKQTGGSKRNALLKWCQNKTAKYKGIDITNFSSSWNDGLAFCALLHTYLPNKIPYDELNSQDKKRNFNLAFKAAESVGVPVTLNITDMAVMERPDWQAVMGYVTSVYKHFEC